MQHHVNAQWTVEGDVSVDEAVEAVQAYMSDYHHSQRPAGEYKITRRIGSESTEVTVTVTMNSYAVRRAHNPRIADEMLD